MGSLRSSGQMRTARRIVAASMSVVLAALIVVTGTPGGLSQAAAATGELTWDSRADFEKNASSTDDTTTISGVSTQRVPGSVTLPGPIVSVAAGSYHTVGLKSDGTVVAVGNSLSGQTNTSTWTDVVSVSAGAEHTVGLKSDGTVVAVGYNGDGQLVTSTWTDIVAVAAGGYHTVGLKSDGTVVAVGRNGDGQTNVSTWTGIVAVAAGGFHTLGLKSDGTVVAVGNNDYGQLDTSTWTGIVSVAAGGFHTVGLKSDGTVVAVGRNSSGQTNVSTWTGIVAVAAGRYHTLGLKSDGTVVAVGGNDYGQTDTSAWTGIDSVAAGGFHTLGLKSDGTVVAVGDNGSGQTGTSAWTGIVSVSAGYDHTVGLKSDGTVVAVGDNGDGQTNTSGWVSITGAGPRSGSIGGSGPAVGLRAEAPDGSVGRTSLDAVTSNLRPFQAVKFAVRLSDDGVTWSEPFGSDGSAIDWTSGSGNYLGRAVTDPSARTDLSALPASAHIDIVVRLETAGSLTPELKSVTLGYQLNDAPQAPTNVKYTLSGANTLITWTKSADALGYHIYVNGCLAGTRGATASSLIYEGRLGPNSKVEVQAVGKDSLTSAKVSGAYVDSGYTKVGTVRFYAYSARLSTMDKGVLRDMASLVASRGYTSVFIGGHASYSDALGVSAYGKWISGKRAKAAKKYLAAQLAKRGSKATIYTEGCGSSRPVASNKTYRGRRLNRRAEIHVK